jgi:manganese-dependent inorganic pyrophosphatase
MLGGIISDTLALTSPTTTEYDKYVVTKLEKISSLKLEEYAYDIFNASSKLDEKTPLELIDLDTKTFHYDNNRTFRISQVALMDATNILAMKEDIIKELNNIRDNKDYDFIIFAVTDISHKGSFILYSETGNSIKYLSMRFKDLEQGMFMDGVMSRKKQLVPLIMEVE